MAIHKFTREIYLGKDITIFGDGTSKRDYTYIEDIISGINKAINIKSPFEIFNLGESKVVELRYLIELIEKRLGKKAKIKYLPEQPGDVPITYADISKSQDLLGYQPNVNIEEGIDRFITWFMVNQ